MCNMQITCWLNLTTKITSLESIATQMIIVPVKNEMAMQY